MDISRIQTRTEELVYLLVFGVVETKCVPDIEPVENMGCKLDVNWALECGHVRTYWICNDCILCAGWVRVWFAQVPPINSLNSSVDTVHMMNMSSINLFQVWIRSGGLFISCVSSLPMNMFA